MDLDSMQRILEQTKALRKPIWEVVRDYDVESRMTTPEASMERMRDTWRAMVDAADGYSGRRRSLSGLVGGDGERMREYYRHHTSIGGEFTAEVMAQALAMGENNALHDPHRGRAHRRRLRGDAGGADPPVAQGADPRGEDGGGAVCGQRHRRGDRRQSQHLRRGRGLSGGDRLGQRPWPPGRRPISTGPCRSKICHAAAIALKNLLGLAVRSGGRLVEVPCVKRNVIGAMNAIAAADMALAGVESRIPVDEVIEAMGDVGRRLPSEFRETAPGRLAVTPTGMAVKERMAGSKKKHRTLTIKDSRWKMARPRDDGGAPAGA